VVLDEAKKERVKTVFKLVAAYKEDSRNSTAAATEAMSGLAEELTVDKGEQKVIKKALGKAFKEYEAELKNEPDSLPDMLDFVNVVCKGTDE
jgi:RAB protein geranylgeranyltransferase component A